MRNQERARPAPQGNTQGLHGPQFAVLFPIARQEPGQTPTETMTFIIDPLCAFDPAYQDETE
jgi:hypothetical protein